MIYRLEDWQAGKPLPKGFDVADAVRDGWSKPDIEAFMRSTARPWGDHQTPPLTPPSVLQSDPSRNLQTSVQSFDDLLAIARALLPDDIEGLERVLIEARDLPAIRQDAILRSLKQATGIGITTLKKQMREADDEKRGVDHLELARWSIESIGIENIICTGPFVWMWSDCGVWKQRDDRFVKQRVQRRIETEGLPVNSTLVNGVTEVLKTEIFRPEHRFNLGHVETINAMNGQIVPHKDGWRLEPHAREHYRTTQIPVAFDPAARADRFDRFLDEVFRDDEDRVEKRAALMEMIGYTLMSHARHELFALMIGVGGNGKSVVLAIIEALCGSDNVAGVQPSNFDRSFQRAHLDQKLANIVTEIKQGEVIADAELKGIVSGENSTVEHKFQDPFDMHPFATCWFGTNHMPHTRDFSDALFRRAMIFSFNRVFTDADKDAHLKDTLKSELPGILNMALSAYRRATIHGFTKPPSSEAAKLKWRLEADQVAMFVDECCTREIGAMVQAGDLFREYKEWANRNGIKQTVTQKSLRDRLTNLGFGASRDRSSRYVTGLKLNVWSRDEDGW